MEGGSSGTFGFLGASFIFSRTFASSLGVSGFLSSIELLRSVEIAGPFSSPCFASLTAPGVFMPMSEAR